MKRFRGEIVDGDTIDGYSDTGELFGYGLTDARTVTRETINTDSLKHVLLASFNDIEV